MEPLRNVEIVRMKDLKDELTRFMLSYKFGIDEVMTKFNILREEFHHIHSYNPIERVSSRLKSAQSVFQKVQRKGGSMAFEDVREQIRDIAGVRVTCSFLSDIYTVRNMLLRQQDITVLAERDYIADPKPNGYKSLHLIISVPVFMSDRVENVTVEIQIRTIAMDFWASLEHKIYYKYSDDVPEELILGLRQAAETASELDVKMEQLHAEMRSIKAASSQSESGEVIDELLEIMPSHSLLESILTSQKN